MPDSGILDVLPRYFLIFFAAVKLTLQIPDDVRRCRQTRCSRCSGAEKLRKILRTRAK